MAELSLGEGKWRMLRRALRAKRFRFEDVRGMRRRDDRDFDWLVTNGFFVRVGGGVHEVTGKGEAAADLGLYRWEPAPPPARGGKPRRRK